MANQARCHPLTIVDDHSRFAICLAACPNEQGSTVQHQLEMTFRRYGLPDATFVDNGGPWGDSAGSRWTRVGVWLLKHGVDVLHSRPFHPQSRAFTARSKPRYLLSNGSAIWLAQRAISEMIRRSTGEQVDESSLREAEPAGADVGWCLRQVLSKRQLERYPIYSKFRSD